MVITTSRLEIVYSLTDQWVEISIFPKVDWYASSMKPVIIKYDADSLESDVELEIIIGLFNGEHTWRRLHLEGGYLEPGDFNKDFYSLVVPAIEIKAEPRKKLDHFTINIAEFWTRGLPEIHYLREDYLSNRNHISAKTAMRLEALKYVRLAIENASSLEELLS